MIVDANVVIYWFADTPLTPPSRLLLGRSDLRAPAFVRMEVANGLLKFVRAGFMMAGQVHRSLRQLDEAIAEFGDDRLLLPDAIDITGETGHKICDCLYLALAARHREPLATADRRLAELAQMLAIETELIEPTG